MNLADVLWIGGPPGSGTAELAAALARRFDLQLYDVDDAASAHAPRMPRLSPDALREASPREELRSYLETARHRFRLVLEDLRELDDAPMCVVAGPPLLPTSVAAVLRSLDHALFVVPDDDEPLARTFEREARDLRLAVVRPETPLGELVERAAAHFAAALARVSGEGDRST